VFEGKPVGTPGRGSVLAGDLGAQCGELFTAPTAFRAIKKEDPRGELIKYDLSSFRSLFLAGERADPDTINGRRTSSACR
jgi:propionyl-CoA synthetase